MKIENDLQMTVSQDAATILIVHDVQKDKHDLYDDVIEKLIDLLEKQTGFLSVDVLRPHGNSLRYVAIMRFDTETHALEWLNLPQRKDLLAPVQPWLLAGDQHQIQTDPDFWFKPNVQDVGPKMWKRFLSSWFASIPLALTIPASYIWLFKEVLHWPTSWVGIPISLTIAWCMTYLTMPYITKILSGWLSK